MSFIFLASPYTDPDAEVRLTRYTAALDCVAWLTERKMWTFSPIVHCHVLAIWHNLPKDYGFWQNYSHAMIRASNRVLVLAIPGLAESRGVADEIAYALNIDRTVQYIFPDDTDGYVLSAYA